MAFRCVLALWVAASLLFPQEAKRAPVPTAQAQKDAESMVRSVFKDEYSKKFPDVQQALAKKLLLQGRETKDDLVARYVLFREAMDIATKAGDFVHALEAADATAESYEVDKFALKAQVLVDGALLIKSPDPAKSFVESCLKFADAAVAADRLDEARAVLGKAELASKTSKDLNLVTRVQRVKKDVEGLAADAQKAKEAEATLRTVPEDPAANLALGKYLLAKGTPERAIPLLAKGSDPALKAAAEKELAAPKDGQAQLQAGNAWWEIAEKEKEGPYRRALQDRARGWYESAYAQTTGLSRVAIDKRLDALDRAIPSGPPTPPSLRVVAYAEFEAMASRFPQDQDLAAKFGKATASSFYPDRPPLNVFRGERRSNAWTLDNSTGWFEARWEPPVRGRTLVLIGRNSTVGNDGWGNATLTLNGSVKLPVLGMGGGTVMIVELGTAGKLQSVRADIAGSQLPGLSAVEVYR